MNPKIQAIQAELWDQAFVRTVDEASGNRQFPYSEIPNALAYCASKRIFDLQEELVYLKKLVISLREEIANLK
jgi:hypothetical protein